ncbi:MAG: hypothetical protein PIR53_05045 [Nocardioides alkalitolerans]
MRDDGVGFDLVARVPGGFPRHEWSLDLGDAIHNLRSAFDAVAWGMAHFRGDRPAKPRAVSFPICEVESQWRLALKSWVGDLPSAFQKRILALQPFTYAPAGGASILSLLHDLDVQDKHREMLSVSVNLSGLDFNGAYEYRDASPAESPRLDLDPDVEFGNGAVLGTFHAGAPIKQIGETFLRPAVAVQLPYRDLTLDVMPFLENLLTETRRYLDILHLGLDKRSDGVPAPPAKEAEQGGLASGEE